MFVGVERELRPYLSSYRLTSELRLPPQSIEAAQDLGFGMGDRLAEPSKGQTRGEHSTTLLVNGVYIMISCKIGGVHVKLYDLETATVM